MTPEPPNPPTVMNPYVKLLPVLALTLTTHAVTIPPPVCGMVGSSLCCTNLVIATMPAPGSTGWSSPPGSVLAEGNVYLTCIVVCSVPFNPRVRLLHPTSTTNFPSFPIPPAVNPQFAMTNSIDMGKIDAAGELDYEGNLLTRQFSYSGSISSFDGTNYFDLCAADSLNGPWSPLNYCATGWLSSVTISTPSGPMVGAPTNAIIIFYVEGRAVGTNFYKAQPDYSLTLTTAIRAHGPLPLPVDPARPSQFFVWRRR